MLGSMGQVGSAGDNSAIDSFFSLVQEIVLNRQTHSAELPPSNTRPS
jgi:hypothetical protein